MENSNLKSLKEIIKEKKPIILIGGTSGTGKTTIGNILLNELSIDHSIGTGWIREITSVWIDKEKYPELFTHSFRPTTDLTPFEHFCEGTKSLLPSIKACIERARREGTSLIIEGVYLTPGLIEEKY